MEYLGLCWAVPFEWPILGARIEAYQHIESRLPCLKLCHRYATSSSFSKMPPEVLEMIIDQWRDLVYVERLAFWRQYETCSEHACHVRDHLTKEEIEECDSVFPTGPDSLDPNPNLSGKSYSAVSSTRTTECLDMHGVGSGCTACDRHRQALNKFRTFIIDTGSYSTDALGDCNQTLDHHFRITSDFLVIPNPNGNQAWDKPGFENQLEVNGYLTMHLTEILNLTSQPSADPAVNFTIRQSLDFDEITRTSNFVKAQFRKAIKGLGLDRPHLFTANPIFLDFQGEPEDDYGNGIICSDLGYQRRNVVRPQKSHVNSLTDQHCLECNGPHLEHKISSTSGQPILMVLGNGSLPSS